MTVSAVAVADGFPGLREVRETYDRLHERLLESQRGQVLDNVNGGIVWGTSCQLDSSISMFEATGDRFYLDRFIDLANRVLEARADKQGQLDYRGRLTYGWLSGGRYTLGKPTVLLDREGNPSLEIRTIANSYNDKTTLELLPGDSEFTFTLKVLNTRDSENPVEETFADLTIEGVEESVNPKPGGRKLARVKRLGNLPPLPHSAFTPETELMTFHGHHTGRILTPFARFCAVVANQDDLEPYRGKAEEYLQEVRISMLEHDQFFIEDGDTGYTIFEKGSPFWCDGVPEPHNTMACSGSTYIHLYRATGEPYFLDRATRLARLFKRNHIEQPDGTWMFHYWYGIVHEGWSEEDNISVNLPSYPGVKTPEDISHFQLTLLFLADCYENGIVFEEEDLERWAKTFHETIYREDPEGSYLSFRVNGEQSGMEKGASNHVLYGLFRLGGHVDPAVVEKCQEILYRKHLDNAAPTVLFSLANLANVRSSQDR